MEELVNLFDQIAAINGITIPKERLAFGPYSDEPALLVSFHPRLTDPEKWLDLGLQLKNADVSKRYGYSGPWQTVVATLENENTVDLDITIFVSGMTPPPEEDGSAQEYRDPQKWLIAMPNDETNPA